LRPIQDTANRCIRYKEPLFLLTDGKAPISALITVIPSLRPDSILFCFAAR
jgi:hypothetical protein